MKEAVSRLGIDIPNLQSVKFDKPFINVYFSSISSIA